MRKSICVAALILILNSTASYGGEPLKLAELGSAEFVSKAPIAPSSLAERTLVYTVGESGIAQGGSIQIRVPFPLPRSIIRASSAA